MLEYLKWMNRIKKYKWILLAVLACSAGLGFFIMQHRPPLEMKDEKTLTALPTPKSNEKSQDPPKEKQKAAALYIDVKGAVQRPGVYEAAENERVEDIIKKAGGFKEKADLNQVNLAEKLHDEMVLYIPVKGEKKPFVNTTGQTSPVLSNQNQTSTSKADAGKTTVNINQADAAGLQTIPGIGPSKAKAIIDYRTQNGAFKKTEDLRKVAGIGDKTYEKLADSITVN